MPRKKLVRTREHVYHITTRSNSKEWFYLPIHECWEICVEALEKSKKKFNIELHAFVLMNNHYHMMVRTPECDIDVFMQFFNKFMSSRINMAIGKVNHVFGTPYKWSIIDNSHYYANAIRYLYQNPVRAGLCLEVESYPYSTLNKESRKKIKLARNLKKLDSKWLNRRYTTKEKESIRIGLKRTKFFVRDSNLKIFLS